jgi:hypothetical protein
MGTKRRIAETESSLADVAHADSGSVTSLPS